MKILNKKLSQRKSILFYIFWIIFMFCLSFGTWSVSADKTLYKEEVLSKKVSLKSSEVWSGTFKEYNLVFYRPMPDEKPGPLRKRGEKLPFSGSIEVMDKEVSIYQRVNIKNGIKEGEAQTFYEEGRLYEKGNFKKGKKEGKWETYRYNGNIMFSQVYKNGKEHGKFTGFDNEGRVSSMSSYRNGKKHGKFTDFDNEGRLRVMGSYRNGKLHGKYIKYRKGKPIYKNYYIFGKRIMRKKLES